MLSQSLGSPLFKFQFLKPWSQDRESITEHSGQPHAQWKRHLWPARAREDAKATAQGLVCDGPLLSHKAREAEVSKCTRRGSCGRGKVCVTSLLLTLSLTQIPVHQPGDAGKSFIKQRAAYSAVKKSFHLSQGSDERHELMRGFLWRMWLRGLGGWVRGRGRRGSRCEVSGRRRGPNLGWW